MRRVLSVALPPVAALAAAVLAASLAGAAPAPSETRSSAVGLRLTVPGEGTTVVAQAGAPPVGSDAVAGWASAGDAPPVVVGSVSVSVAAQPGVSAGAQAVADVLGISLLGGEVKAAAVNLRASAAAGPAGAAASTSSSTVSGLVVLGQPVAASANQALQLGDWGSLRVLDGSSDARSTAPRLAGAAVAGLRVELQLEHGGLPAGTVIEVGVVEAAAVAAEETAPATAPPPKPSQAPLPAPVPRRPPGDGRPDTTPQVPREPGASIAGRPEGLVQPVPEGVRARLTRGGYVFPVFGPASFGDSFGAYRSDVAGKWHHGEDIVATFGAPVLAVADGTVFSVGWNDIGGWRLWLRDGEGNEFYYAHLSAYSPLATEGATVRAGDVLGFVGDSGDAEGGIQHLHFEIHPVSLLAQGYDGVVAPYPFLVAWRRAEDVSFAAGRAYLPDDGPPGAKAPPAGAVLLEASDISRTSGLVPGALERALAVPGPSGGG